LVRRRPGAVQHHGQRHRTGRHRHLARHGPVRRRVDPVKTAEEEKRIPLRRLGVPEDCARVVEFLASELSDYVTGQVISVCGGMVLSPS